MPPVRIALSNAGIRAALVRLRYEAAPHQVHLLGIRGATPVGPDVIQLTQNLPDCYNDTIAAFGAEWQLFPASVDPGQTYTDRPLDADGCAHLCNGRYEYRVGEHRGHVALVQVGAVRVWRDRDKEHVQDPHELVETGEFGINIHAGGTQISVGPNSAGCQVIQGGWEGRYWNRFLELCAGSGQRRFSYFLVDALDLMRNDR